MKDQQNNSMPRTVIIVEDAEPSASTLEIALLSLPGVAVLLASSGQEAWKLLQSLEGASICALVTDLHMPRMDGFELIERIRSDQRIAELPIVVISGDTDPRTPERLHRLGANAYFAKPYSPAAVREKLEQLLDANPVRSVDPELRP